MSWIFYLLVAMLWAVISVIMSYNVDAPDGRMLQKRFAKKVKTIMDLSSESIEISNKGKTFKIKFEEHENKSIRYESIPYYKYIDIYVGKQLVCRLHRLGISYQKYVYRAEFSSKVLYSEVVKLIDIAYKEVLEKKKISKIKKNK